MMRRKLAGPGALLVLLAACSSDGPSAPLILDGVQLLVVSGDAQVGEPGTELPDALVARITDSKGKALKDVLVNYRVVQGGGSIFAGSAISDANGLVRDYWTLGLSGPQLVEVRAVDRVTGEKQVFASFTAAFAQPVDQDGDGYSVAQGDCNDNDPSIHPGAPDDPDPNFVDSNCDGIDGTASGAVFVAPSGADGAACGDIAAPCATIGTGVLRAGALGRSQVFIAVGTYTEAVQLSSGVSLYGGYSSDFTGRSLLNRALINGTAQYQTSGVMYTLLGENLTQPTAVVALAVQAPNATGQRTDGSGRDAVGILLRFSGSVTISYTHIAAGNGSAGLSGVAGTDASQSPGQSGQNGQPAQQIATLCDATSRGAGGPGAGTGALAGGAGGAGGTMDTDCSNPLAFNLNARPGMIGFDAAVAAFPNGHGGTGGGPCIFGTSGTIGPQVSGASGPGGTGPAVLGGFLRSSSGSSGQLGQDGTGGGGGGGSGGCDTGTDAYGAGGGGGGSGGLRAPAPGNGGHGGGASVGIYLTAASATLLAVDIVRGAGGGGGIGGAGGRGQPGGMGGSGGPGAGGAQAGGNGGNGGDGGFSGAGGGGAGGPSIGVLSVAGSATANTAVSVTGGSGGTGGPGGPRGDGNFGGTGSTGMLVAILQLP